MGRAYTGMIPPEYQVAATQVTNSGEPNYANLTRQNYGTIGRSVMGSNDMQDIGGEPEVYSDEMDPLAFASQQTAKMVQKLKRESALSQTPDNLSKMVDKTQVQYNDISRDDQVSNVKGMRFTGDPASVGQAMKYHGDAKFETGRALDGSDIQASLDRAATGMDKASRSALAQALAHLGPEAIESLPQSSLAGLADGLQIAGNTSVAGVVMRPTGYLPTMAPRTPVLPGKTTVAPKSSAKLRTIQARPSLLQAKAATRAAVPAAFTKLLAERQKEAEQNAVKPVAKFHPSQSNFEDSQGRANTTAKLVGAEAKRQMAMAMQKLAQQLQTAWGNLTPAQQKQLQALLKILQTRWAKMTPKQRQDLVNQFQQKLVMFARATQNARAKAQAAQKASKSAYKPSASDLNATLKQKFTGSSRRTSPGDAASMGIAKTTPTSASNATDTIEAYETAAAAQNGDRAAQKKIVAGQFREKIKQQEAAKFNTTVRHITGRLNLKERAALSNLLERTKETRDLTTEVGREAALNELKQKMDIVTTIKGSLAAQGQGAKSSSETVNDDATIWTDDGSGLGTDGSGFDPGTWDDITADSQGNYDNRVNPWIIGGAVTAAAVVGGWLLMKGNK